VDGNEIGFDFSGKSAATLDRSRVSSNLVIGSFLDSSEFEATDSGFRENRLSECDTVAIGVEPSLLLADTAAGTFHNTLWAANCTDGGQSDDPLISVLDNASIAVTSSTLDNNRSAWIIKAEDNGTVTALDSIFSDNAGSFTTWDGGILCVGSASASLDYLGLYGFAASSDVLNRSYPTTFYTAWPNFQSLLYKINGAGTVEVREYYLPIGSIYIDQGSLVASVVGLGSPYGTQVPPPGPSGTPYAQAPDTSTLDIGWHWWVIPGATVP